MDGRRQLLNAPQMHNERTRQHMRIAKTIKGQIPPVYVISLKHREHRVKGLLPKLGDPANVIIVEAVDGVELEPVGDLTSGEVMFSKSAHGTT